MPYTIKRDEWKAIHEAIHSPEVTEVKIGDVTCKIEMYSNKCRFVDYKNFRFMEQNKNKNSEYAKRAKEGKHITWIMPKHQSGSWMRIEDDTLFI